MGAPRRAIYLILLAGFALYASTAARPAAPTPHREMTLARLHRAGAGTSPALPAAAPSACSDGAYSLGSAKWTQVYNFYVKTSTVPSGLTSDAAVSALRAAAVNVVRGDNDCGIAANVGASADYRGSTSSSANITTSGGCGTADRRNVVDFGTLPSGYLAMTCWWSSSGSIIEADVRLNKSSFGWVTTLTGCSNKFMVEAVATHEFGHAFGMNHVSESSHGKLTMSPTMSSCQNSESSLGLGDVRGLEAKY